MSEMIFPEVKTRFGFGCLRLPMDGKKVDIPQMKKMVDVFLERGYNYFDTARGYIEGLSEKALKECLTSRYPRDKYLITDKLTEPYFRTNEDIRPFFESQLEACGVEYFDFYLMHALDSNNYPHFQKCKAFETALELKKEGKIKHLGMSFHDEAKLLDRILTDHPEVEIVQIQFNYMDYDSIAVQGKETYEVCLKHGKPTIIMEPVKGGTLINLPADAQKVLDDLNAKNGTSYSNAAFALRYTQSFDNNRIIISGMSTIEQMLENMDIMSSEDPLSSEEMEAVYKVKDIVLSKKLIPCTTCRYCEAGCPLGIKIPDMFTCLNAQTALHDWNHKSYYRDVLCREGGKASECIKCGQCEGICPQHLPITSLLEDVAKAFES